MNCKKCGKENSDNSIYCSNCGYRLDGKKKCGNCSQMIDENAIYCNFCGSRVDGKSVCKNCGSVYDGVFCTQCGASKNENAVKKVKNSTSPKNVFNKIVNIVAPCLVLVALLVLFINSFLLGVQLIVNEGAVTGNSLGEGKSVLYFFGDVYKDAANSFKWYDKTYKNNLNLPVAKLSYYMSIVICTIAFATNIIVSLITLIVASIKTGVALYKNEEVNNTKYFAISFCTFIVSIILLLSYYCVKTANVDDLIIQIKLNGFSVFAIVVSLVVTVGNWILKTIGNFNVKHFVKDIITFSSMLVILLMVVALKGEYVSLTESTFDETISLSPSLLMSRIMIALLTSKNPDVIFSNVGVWTIVSYVLFISLIILVAFSIKNAINNTASNKKSYVTALVLSLINTFITVAYLVVTIIFVSNISNFALQSGSELKTTYIQPILLVVFAVLVLGLSIANLVIKTEEEKEIEYYCTDF